MLIHREYALQKAYIVALIVFCPDLITDVYGTLSYAPNFDINLQKVLDTLKVGGKLIFMVPIGEIHPTSAHFS